MGAYSKGGVYLKFCAKGVGAYSSARLLERGRLFEEIRLSLESACFGLL